VYIMLVGCGMVAVSLPRPTVPGLK
jgi:hypothetical protein